MWAGVTGFFDGINLYESGAKLLNTFVDGIKSMASAPIKAVEDVLAKVREYLPFSDAHTGPLSQLTLSGTRMMTTIGEGVGQGAPALLASVSGALGSAGQAISGWWNGLFGKPQTPDVGSPEIADAPTFEIGENSTMRAGSKEARGGGSQSWTITIQELHLPNVEKAEDFVSALMGEMEQYGEA